ncbi:carboxypeptidase-like regulatory domain-containing protein [Anditalea andensis]|uniref:Dienelactone hydrolase domain-containing protein n=1 Tax=Anditalea andensis TaxID=1048983 RepID=A0A074L429_9BACT|nr:carboxypeptidase-like regulatory domain-containing protein [Anditalea andensis]KEO75205.1 hypothetical protein EL17_05965 [Anditalea andensis]
MNKLLYYTLDLNLKPLNLLCFFLLWHQNLLGQDFESAHYSAGYKSINLVDSSRVYKEGTEKDDPLHYRHIELDIWYPSSDNPSNPIKFGELFKLLEQRSSKYGEEDFEGFTEEMMLLFLAEMDIDQSPQKLLDFPTNSYLGLEPILGKVPLVIYLAGLNGMGFENYKVLESLAQQGFLVVSIWSVGRYPGNMSNKIEDMMEQVMDAEVALEHLKKSTIFSIQEDIGILGMSWGSMSSAVLVARNPEIKAFLSFDGSEMHYFGDQSDVDDEGILNDNHIHKIIDTDLLKPSKQHINYMYLESDGKTQEFDPVSEFNYYELLNSNKKYLRFIKSQHTDFTSLPSLLDVSDSGIHTHIINIAGEFFLQELTPKNANDEYWTNLIKQENISIVRHANPAKTVSVDDKILKGKIIDSKTKTPLSYVNIGFLNKERGTVSDENGKFELEINEKDLEDTLRISMIGYTPIKIIPNNFSKTWNQKIIELDEMIGALNEVIVSSKGYKSKVLGNKTESKFISTAFSYDQLGAEMGIKVKIRKSPTYVDSLNFNVSYNRLSAKAIFRVNFYAVENGQPGKNILKDNILIEINPKQTGLISVDLLPYDIILEEDTFVTLEWIKNEGINEKGEAIYFSLGLLNNATIYKPSSQSRFKKHSSLGVGFNLNVKQ